MGVTAAVADTVTEAVSENQAIRALFERGVTKDRRFYALFDIVDVDEGTCGRRLRGLCIQGARER